MESPRPVRHLGVWFLGHRLLGGSWVVISGVMSKVTMLVTRIRGLITLLITAPKP